MKTHEQITPEQQIENQKQEIQTLQRKVDNLEAELQKHLDPDRGEINPAIRYHYKDGEEALLEQIQTLEKQLADCTEPSSFFTPSNRFNACAEDIIESLFKPVDEFVPIESPGSGKYVKKDRKYAWDSFRTDLFNARHIDSYWPRPEFRMGVEVVTAVTAILEREFFVTREPGYADIVPEFILFDPKEKIVAVDCLIEVLQTFHGIEDRRMNDEEMSDIMLSLKTISLIQKCGGYLIHGNDDDDSEETCEEESTRAAEQTPDL